MKAKDAPKLAAEEGGGASEGQNRLNGQLLAAAELGDEARVEALILQGADPHARDQDGRGAIMLAVMGRRRGCVEVLLPRGEALAGDGCPEALGMAAEIGWAEGVEALASPEAALARDRDGDTPLGRAARAGHVECVEALLARAGGLGEPAGLRGETLLMAAARSGNDKLVELLAPLSDPDAKDCHGMTALAQAAWFGKAGCLRVLLRHADPNIASGKRTTPLMLAALSESAECVKMLLGRCDPLARDKDGKDALMHAACWGSAACVAELLPCSDLSALDAGGRGAAELAEGDGGGELGREIARLIRAYAASKAEAEALAASSKGGGASRRSPSI